MAILLIAVLLSCAVFGVVLLFIGWFWVGLIMLLTPIVIIIWLLSLGDAV